MGYRLEFRNPNQHDEFVPDCGGKLFGYIENDELEKCKSWQWIKNNGFLSASRTNGKPTKTENL